MHSYKSADGRVKIRKDLFIFSFVIVVITAIAANNVEQGTIEAGADESIERLNVNRGQTDISTAGAIEPIIFEENTEIRDALRFLAAKYQKNIVPSPKVEGQLPFTSLFDVAFEEAMAAVLGVNFKYEQTGHLIRVYTAEEYKKLKEDSGRMVYKMFTLYYVNAAEAMKLLSPVLSGAGSIAGTSAAETGISTGKESVSSGAVGGDSMVQYDTIVIYDYPENIAKAQDLISQLDVRPKQVLIEATILSATLTEGMEFGINWNLLQGVSLDGTDATETYTTSSSVDRGTEATSPVRQIAQGIAGAAMETTGFASAASGLRIGITSGDLAGFITALESITDITVLANPKILALNKQAGTVFIGQKIGYRDRTTISDSGQATVGEVKFLDTGTKLSFRPYIGNDGYIRMDIYPKDSSGELDDEGIPTETTAELTTNIMVKDGETIVIGGLFRDAIVTTRSQVPLLGDLPFVGVLFRGTRDSNKRQEVIVMLTPHIINEPEETLGKARAADISRKRSGAKEGLQWTGRARLAEDYYENAASSYVEGDNEAAMREINLALELRPTYLEAIRLKEKIIGEIAPDEVSAIERNVRDAVEREDTKMWLRR